MTPAVIGHRGWPARFPDNTLSGFLSAAAFADGFEVDVRRSGDGKLVLSHDPWLDGLQVSLHPWSVLGEVDLGAGHRPAVLDEVIAAVPAMSFQFEVKNFPHEPGFEPDHRLALEAAERARPGDMITSFNWSTLSAVRRIFPEVDTGVLVPPAGDIDRAVQECLREGHGSLLPSVGPLWSDLARALESGLLVYPWVVDEPAVIIELADIGVSGIITDDPVTVRSVLRSQQE